MIKAFKYSTSVACSQKRYEGFALIAALSLMAFILILMVSLSVMVRVDYRAATSSVLQAEAKQNALLGLHQALGTLQEELGPDQRISANADILNSSNGDITAGDNALSVANPYLTGVWDSSGDKNNETLEARRAALWSPGDAIDYPTRASQGFRRWLISTPENGSLGSGATLGGFDPKTLEAAANSTIRDDQNSEVVNLLGAGTLEPTANNLLASDLPGHDRVKAIWAPLVTIDSPKNSLSVNRMAWTVLDEGVKARFNLPAPTKTESIAGRLQVWDNPGDYGIENIGESSGAFSNYPNIRDQVLKTNAFDDATALLFYNGADRDILGSFVHDITLHSTSVLSNVVDGGLKRDLALLADERPAEYTSRYLYSDAITPINGSTASAEPTWPYLLDYINLYKDTNRLQAGNSALELPVARVTQTNWEGSDSRTPYNLPLPARNSYEFAPTITKVEFYISMLGNKPQPQGGNDQFHHRFYRTNASLKPSTRATADTIAANRPLVLGLMVAPVLTL